MTTKNSQKTFVRVPNFSPPSAQRFAHTDATLPLSSNDEQPVLRSFTAERKRQERVLENEEQRSRRLICDRQRKAAARENEDELERSVRLTHDRRQKEAARAIENPEKARERIRSISVRRRNRLLENKNTTKHGLDWPAAILEERKDQCLQDFVNQTSMSALKQAVCAVCNIRTFASSLNEYTLNEIPNREKLACHPDLLRIIPDLGTIPRVARNNCLN